jgi:hypothetical protein
LGNETAEVVVARFSVNGMVSTSRNTKLDVFMVGGVAGDESKKTRIYA